MLGHSSDSAMFTTMTNTTTLSILQSLLDKSIGYKLNFTHPIVITNDDSKKTVHHIKMLLYTYNVFWPE